MHMKIFKPGTQVQYNGEWFTVDHVGVSGYRLRVYLVGRIAPVDDYLLDCERTTLNFNR